METAIASQLMMSTNARGGTIVFEAGVQNYFVSGASEIFFYFVPRTVDVVNIITMCMMSQYVLV
jgi:hypothetical protein